MKIEQVFVDGVDVGERLRPLNEATVESLVESMGRLGLLQPITVYTPDNNRIILVAGYHRLEAARRLEWDEIDCIFVNADEIECQLREIAENLHRAELTALERDEHIAKWVELAAIKVRQVDEPLKGGRQPNEKGQAKAARELGISEPDARRAAKVASLSDEAKQVARDTGLDNNRSALLKAAKESASADQVRMITELALAKVHKPVPPAPEPHNPVEAYNKWEAEMNRSWGRAPLEWREQWLAKIDRPVMDRRAV